MGHYKVIPLGGIPFTHIFAGFLLSPRLLSHFSFLSDITLHPITIDKSRTIMVNLVRHINGDVSYITVAAFYEISLYARGLNRSNAGFHKDKYDRNKQDIYPAIKRTTNWFSLFRTAAELSFDIPRSCFPSVCNRVNLKTCKLISVDNVISMLCGDQWNEYISDRFFPNLDIAAFERDMLSACESPPIELFTDDLFDFSTCMRESTEFLFELVDCKTHIGLFDPDPKGSFKCDQCGESFSVGNIVDFKRKADDFIFEDEQKKQKYV